MIHSMTAYAQAEINCPPHTVRAEIRSLNSRYLDIAIHLPRNHVELECRLQALVTEKLNRGRVEIRIQIDEDGPREPAFTIDIPMAEAYYQALMTLKCHLGLGQEVTLDHLLAVGDIIRPVEANGSDNDYGEVVETCLTQALSDLVAMRRHEGKRLAADIDGRLTFIEEGLAWIETHSQGLVQYHQQRLTERIRALTEDVVAIDPDRIVREAALLADRGDISEELVRAASHLVHFRELMAMTPSTGRKLNFLLQELHREFNTMGAKTEKAEVGHRIVDIKSEIEKIREQVQNIE